MLRTALQPRWLGLLGVVLAVAVGFGLLGAWQLDVARDRGHEEALREAAARPAAPLGSVVRPHSPFPAALTGRRVTVTGSYDATGQVLVTDRLQAGQAGAWLVTPLVVDGTGARLAVLRGFLSDSAGAPASLPAPPPGRLMLSGALGSGESPVADRDRAGSGAADGIDPVRLPRLDLAVLVNRWPGALYNAVLFVADERRAGTDVPAAAGLERVPPPEPPAGGLLWRNAAYAVQWWVFGLFAVYMWWRMVRDAADGGAGEVSNDSGADRAAYPQGAARPGEREVGVGG